MLEPGDWALGFSRSSFNELLAQIRQGSMRFASFWASGNPHTVRLTAAIDRLRMLFDGEMDSDIPVLECELVGEVYRLLSLLASTAARTPQEYLHNRDLTFIRSVAGYVSEHFAAPISGADICSALGFSRRNFSRLFRRSFGTTFTDYLREYRIRRAATDFRGSKLPVYEVAAAVGFSPNYLSRKFRQAAGVGLHEYLVFVRLHHAALELVSTRDSIITIALRRGFSDSNYFKDSFKKKYGVTPRAYRKLT